MAVLDERFVRRAVIKHLSRQGYSRRLKEKETNEKGIDIKVQHNRYPRYFLVEVKGEPNPETHKNVSSGREVAFNIALGQIVQRMKYKAKYWYAVAFPNTFRDKVIRRLPKQVCKKLRLKVFLVNKEGKVEELTWRDLN